MWRDGSGGRTVDLWLAGGDQLQSAIEMFDDGRATIDPVTAVGIGETVAGLYCRAMDMATDDAVEAAPARGVDHRVLEVEDEGNRVLYAPFGIAGE